MDRAEIIEEIRERVGESEAYADFFTPTRINRLINRAQVRFCHEEQWPWLYTYADAGAYVSGDNEIPLIPNVAVSRHWAVVLVKSNGGLIIPKRITPGESLLVRQQTYSSTGEPRWYVPSTQITIGADDFQSIKLFPALNQAVDAEYHYIREPVPMADDDEVPDIPDPYHDAIVAWVTAKLWEQELRGAEVKRQEAIEEYNHVLAQAVQDMKDMALDETVIVGGEQPRTELDSFISWRNLPESLSP